MLSRLRRLLRVTNWPAILIGLSIGMVVSIVIILTTDQKQFVPIFLTAALVLLVVALVLRRWRSTVSRVKFGSTLRLGTRGDCYQYARQAFVGFVSLYTPSYRSSAATLTLEQQRQALESLDFEALDIEASNLAPTIQAITCHASRLEHCWLLATMTQSGASSLSYANLLAQYLRTVKGLNCAFHYGMDYSIPLDDDVVVVQRTYNKVSEVFREAQEMGIPAAEMVVDVTAGTRSMVLGMILASLEGDQDVEVVGTAYDYRGAPQGELSPMIVQFKAQSDG